MTYTEFDEKQQLLEDAVSLCTGKYSVLLQVMRPLFPMLLMLIQEALHKAGECHLVSVLFSFILPCAYACLALL